MPGDLHKLWRTRDPKGYHVEYGYSCMGYEIAGGLGVKMAAPEREVYVLVGDGSYLMLSSEIVTSIQEGLKLTIVLVDNRGYNSIGSLSRSLGTDGFGTQYRYRRNGWLPASTATRSDDFLPVDLAANAESLGARVIRAGSVDELRAALADAKSDDRTTVIAIEVDRYEGVPGYESWWDVAVAEVGDGQRARGPRRVRAGAQARSGATCERALPARRLGAGDPGVGRLALPLVPRGDGPARREHRRRGAGARAALGPLRDRGRGRALGARRPRERLRGDAVGALPAAGHRLPRRATGRARARGLRRAVRAAARARTRAARGRRDRGPRRRERDAPDQPHRQAGVPGERLLVVEVFTPAGNWSSYPPHKHDEDNPPGEVVLEETYYYRTAEPEAFAVQRLYSPRHGVDVTVTVRDGDLMLVPWGYHTTAAAHGYDLYYLNALAGDRRSMASADDPELAWIRSSWEELEPDPRVPLVTLDST